MPAAHPILRIRAPIVGRGEQVYELTASKVTIGRGEDCDIILLEQAASRAHAELRATEEGWLLVDLCSDNGVWVGGERVTRRRLDDGETFRIGETTLQLVLNPHAQPTIVEEGVRAPVVRPKPPFAPPVPETPTSSPVPSNEALASSPDRLAAAVPMPAAVDPPSQPVSPQAPVVPRGDPSWPAPPAAVPAPPPPVSPLEPVAPRDDASWQGPVASAPSFVDHGPVGQPRRVASEPYILGPADGRGPGAGAHTFYGELDRAPQGGRTFHGELAEVSDDDERPEPRAGFPWGLLGMTVVMLLVVGAGVAWALGVRLDDVLEWFR